MSDQPHNPATPVPGATPPEPPPEPLANLAPLAATLAPDLARAEVLLQAYRASAARGDILLNALEALRVELTYHSNAIEGNTLSLRETQLVLEGLTPPGSKRLREVYEARNHDAALRVVEGWARERPATQALTERDVLDLHAIVLKDIDDAHAGRFRAQRVLIAGSRFVPPGAHRFNELLPALLALSAREHVHPLLRAAELHYNLVAVHPFADGNGRTARLLMNLAVLRAGGPLTVVEVERRAEYLDALEAANAGALEPFARFVLGCVERSVARVLGE